MMWQSNDVARADTMRHCVNAQSTVNRSTVDNFRSTMVIRMGEVFDRIDSAAEREAAVRMLCEGRLSDAARERMAAAVTEYDRRRWREVLARDGLRVVMAPGGSWVTL